MKKQIIFLFFLCMTQMILANDGYEIKVSIKNYEEEKLILAHYLGSTILIDDTTTLSENGAFVFKGEKTLPAGIYLIVMPPDNKYIEIFLTEEEKNYSLEFDATTLAEDVVFKNAPDNTLFYEYLHFMSQTRREMEKLIKTIQEGKSAGKNLQKEEEKLEKFQSKTEAYKENIIQNHPEKFTSTILKSNKNINIPKFEGTEQEVRMQEYLYRRTHFFDDVRADTRFFRTKICNEMINFYMDNLTVPHPDSIIQSLDVVLDLISPDSVAFRSYFLNFLNKYLQSEYMGMDAVFVHLVKEYTLKGRTNFFTEETNAKITKDALLWDKTLIGKIAPDLKMYNLDIEGTIKVKDAEDKNRRFVLDGKTYLNSVFSPYTVVIFWAPDCGHCKKSMPVLVDFYEKHQDSVKVFAVCHTNFEQFPDCAETLKNFKATKWINTVDPYYKYLKDYDIQTTPLVLLLDENKKVLYKKIAIEKLELALQQLQLKKQKE